MSDPARMDRTWLCSVLFMDIVGYSSQSVELQMRWKERLNGYLSEAIRNVPENERVILDTGDGAAICFLGAPEAAMFTALQLRESFARDKQEQKPGLSVRLGVNLGPVKLVRDINGSLNALGDGMNAGQRIMSFAGENQILVSQSFFEVVSRLSDDYKALFRLKGIETDKHIREHTVYHLLPPGSAKEEASLPAGKRRNRGSRAALLVAAGVVLAVLGAVGARRLFTSSDRAKPEAGSAVAAQTAPTPPVAQPAPESAAVPPARKAQTQAPSPPKQNAPVSAAAIEPSAAAKPEYDEAMRLIDEDQPGDAIPHFDKALSADPGYIDAFVGRAEARRMMDQFALSMEDCNKVMQLKPDDPRAYNCRGTARYHLGQYDSAISDFSEAIRLNANFVMAYGNRGNAYADLQRYDEAIQDYTRALRLRPKDGPVYFRRAGVYNKLRQYDKAAKDYTEVIRLNPGNIAAYNGRAADEEKLGDAAGAAADRDHAKELRKKKSKS